MHMFIRGKLTTIFETQPKKCTSNRVTEDFAEQDCQITPMRVLRCTVNIVMPHPTLIKRSYLCSNKLSKGADFEVL